VASARRTEALHKLAITDHLTGAYNRRHFYHITDHILRQAKASQFRVTLLLYDIDNFKHYNETYGHAAGDEILRDTAMLMKRTSRSHDVVARIGGDEFAVLFWDVEAPRRPQSKPLEDFFMLAERFRLAVSSHSFASLGPEAQGVLTISGGLANFPADGDSCRQLLRAADHALRNIKRSGKNGIQLIGGEKKGNGKPANGQ
jgi:diguanylate cyclase (GGDEF)-like protein